MRPKVWRSAGGAKMARPSELDANTSSIPYRYDLGVGRDCSISYFVNNQLQEGFLGVQNSGSANHQTLGIGDAEAGVGGKYGSDILS
jgi:hypothetical protein